LSCKVFGSFYAHLSHAQKETEPHRGSSLTPMWFCFFLYTAKP